MEVELSLSDYWGVIRKRYLSVLVVFLLTSVSFAAYTQFIPFKYRSKALVKYEPPLANVKEAGVGAFALRPILETQVSVIKSVEMAERIGLRVGLRAESVKSRYSVKRVESSSLMELTARSTSPVQAAAFANIIARTYIDWDLESRSLQLRTTLEEIIARREKVEKELREKEGVLRDFLKRHESTGLGAALATRLLELQTRKQELLRQFTVHHPDVKKLEERISITRQRLSAMPRQEEILRRMKRDIAVLEQTYIALSQQLEETKIKLDSTLSFVTIVSEAVPPIAPYYPNKPLNYIAGVIVGIILGFLFAFLLENLDISITTIEEIEKVLGAPVLGIIPYFGNKNRWGEFTYNLFRQQRHSEDDFRSFLVIRRAPKSPYIEAYHSLRVNIQAQLERREHMVLTITSAGVAEGKTLSSVNFCLAAAHSGLKTLLIGADIRRPSMHRIFGLPKQPGLIEALTGKMPWRQCIRKTVDILMGEKDLERLTRFPGIDNFKIMTGWSESSAEVVNLFSSHRLVKLIEEMREEFDLVVFDCPPVLLFVDALLIGKHTDGVVMIYKSGKMSRRALKRAKDQVQVSHGRILGIVLNAARATDMEPGYGYYSDYGHYAKPPSESS